jgi:hypothetical protein
MLGLPAMDAVKAPLILFCFISQVIKDALE